MLNIRGKKKKQQYWRRMMLLMTRLEVQYVKQIAPIINKQYKKAANTLNANAIESETITFRKKLKKHYLKTATIFGNEVFDNLKQEKLFNLYDKKAFEDEYINKINLFVDLHVAEQIKKVNKTTKKIIKRIIKNGRDANLTNREIAKKLKDVGSFSSARAKRIAQTETHSIANHSVQSAMETTNIKMEKEWLAAFDARTRATHIEANGQRVAMNADFIINGESLRYPGDPNGSSGNIINCRCVVLYHTKK